MHVLIIDNYDSFVFNLAEEFKRIGSSIVVLRNDVTVESIFEYLALVKGKKLIVISPGPGTPENAGVSIELIKKNKGKYPILGICLGHQAIIEAYGGVVSKAKEIVHGKASLMEHNSKGIFKNMPLMLNVGRYHSLIGTKIPDCLEICASLSGMCMAVQHKKDFVVGLQFHPESILTTYGSRFVENIAKMVNEL